MKQFNAESLVDERMLKLTGHTVAEVAAAHETVRRVQDALVEYKGTKEPSNMPWPMFQACTKMTSLAERGQLFERYACRAFGWTQDNRRGAGDAVDSDGRRHEIKFATVGFNGRVTAQQVAFAGVRTDDDMDVFDLFYAASGQDLVHLQVPRADVKPGFPGFDSKYSRVKFNVSERAGSVQQELLARYQVPVEGEPLKRMYERADGSGFLDLAGVSMDQVSSALQVKDDVYRNYMGTRKNVHATWDELCALTPLLEKGKFGTVMQNWLEDHFELATVKDHLKKGDSRLRAGKTMELKTATVDRAGMVRVQGIRPEQFDLIGIMVVDDDRDPTYFELTKEQMSRVLMQFGSPERREGSYKLHFSWGSEREGSIYQQWMDDYLVADFDENAH